MPTSLSGYLYNWGQCLEMSKTRNSIRSGLKCYSLCTLYVRFKSLTFREIDIATILSYIIQPTDTRVMSIVKFAITLCTMKQVYTVRYSKTDANTLSLE